MFHQEAAQGGDLVREHSQAIAMAIVIHGMVERCGIARAEICRGTMRKKQADNLHALRGLLATFLQYLVLLLFVHTDEVAFINIRRHHVDCNGQRGLKPKFFSRGTIVADVGIEARVKQQASNLKISSTVAQRAQEGGFVAALRDVRSVKRAAIGFDDLPNGLYIAIFNCSVQTVVWCAHRFGQLGELVHRFFFFFLQGIGEILKGECAWQKKRQALMQAL